MDHTLHCARPSPPLREFVRAFAQREVASTAAPIIEPVPARLDSTLEFQFGAAPQLHFLDGRRVAIPRASIVGPYSRFALELSLSADVVTFGIFFRPSGIPRLLGIPLSALANLGFEASSVVGRMVCHFWDELAEQVTFEARVQVAERFLIARIAKAPDTTRANLAADLILARRGRCGVTQLAQHFGLNLRTFQRAFSHDLGVTPKRFIRVARFQTALDAKVHSPRRSWLEIAHEVGYYDQMHLIHDFHELAGGAPESILHDIGDIRPPSSATDRSGSVAFLLGRRIGAEQSCTSRRRISRGRSRRSRGSPGGQACRVA